MFIRNIISISYFTLPYARIDNSFGDTCGQNIRNSKLISNMEKLIIPKWTSSYLELCDKVVHHLR